MFYQFLMQTGKGKGKRKGKEMYSSLQVDKLWQDAVACVQSAYNNA